MSVNAPASPAAMSRFACAKLARRLLRQWKPGDRLPPIVDLARDLEMGQRNTHVAVRELARQGFLVSRPRAGTFVAPDLDLPRLQSFCDSLAQAPRQPDQPARQLLGRAVTVLSTGDVDAMIRTMREHLCESLLQQGARLTHAELPGKREGDMSRFGGDAVVLINPNPKPELVFAPQQVLLVLTTSRVFTVAMAQGFDIVTAEQEQGGFLAGEHLRKLGSRRVAFVGVGRKQGRRIVYDLTSQGRLRGLERGLGCAIQEDHKFVVGHYDPEAVPETVADWMDLPDRPLAVFAASDDLARGFLTCAATHRQIAGRDFQLVGFDGQERARIVRGGPISTVIVPAAEMGRRGGELLTQRLLDRGQPVRRIHLGCTFAQGATTSFSLARKAAT
jgi:DNA-binding LacI/PurR family transcriptional regulator